MNDIAKQPPLLVMPRGLTTLLLLQLFSIATFSVLFASLHYFTHTYFKLSQQTIAAIIISYITLNFILHMFAGIIGGRFFSFRQLFIIGTVLNIIGCLCLFWLNRNTLYWGLALITIGGGITPTCINCLITQLFKPEDKRRETIFLWVYSIMNIGFLLGFVVSDLSQITVNYPLLFISCGIFNITALALIIINWRKLADRNTSILGVPHSRLKHMALTGSLLLILTLLLVRFILQYNHFSNDVIGIIALTLLIIIFILAFKQPSKQARQKIFAFLILMVVGVIFWSINLLVPMGLMVYVKQHAHQHFSDWRLSSQLLNSINALMVIVVGPILGVVFYRARYRGITLEIPLKFAIGMLLAGFALLLLPLALSHSESHGTTHTTWFILSYVLQGLAELFIQPIGLAMIGQLAPINLQGVFMGFWMMLVGISSVFSGYFTQWAHGTRLIHSPQVANQHFTNAFNLLGWLAIGVALILILLKPLLTKMIRYRSLDPTLQKY